MDHERLRHVHGLTVETLRDAYGRHGVTMRDMRVEVDRLETIEMRRPTVGMETVVGRGRDRGVTVRVRTGRDALVRAQAERFAALHLALRAREETVGEHIRTDIVPAWSLLAHPLLAGIVRIALKQERMEITLRRSGASGGYLLDDHGFGVSAGGSMLLFAGGDRFRVSLVAAGVDAAVLRSDVKIRRGTDGAVVVTDGRNPRLRVMDASLPQAVRGAMIGRSLSDVVSHPLFDRTGAVTSARSFDGDPPHIDVTLARALEPIAPPPAGVEAPWLAEIAAATT